VIRELNLQPETFRCLIPRPSPAMSAVEWSEAFGSSAERAKELFCRATNCRLKVPPRRRAPLRPGTPTRSDEAGRIETGCTQSRRAGFEVGVKPKRLSNPPPPAATQAPRRRRTAQRKAGEPTALKRKTRARPRAREPGRLEHGNRKKSNLNSSRPVSHAKSPYAFVIQLNSSSSKSEIPSREI
jgi:hypothetical protein